MLFVLTLSTRTIISTFLLITRVHIKENNVLWPSQLLDFSEAHPQTMPTTWARVIRPLFLPQGAQIEIEYKPCQPSIWTKVRQMEALGYWVSVEPFRGQQDIINGGLTSQHVGAHVLSIHTRLIPVGMRKMTPIGKTWFTSTPGCTDWDRIQPTPA